MDRDREHPRILPTASMPPSHKITAQAVGGIGQGAMLNMHVESLSNPSGARQLVAKDSIEFSLSDTDEKRMESEFSKL